MALLLDECSVLTSVEIVATTARAHASLAYNYLCYSAIVFGQRAASGPNKCTLPFQGACLRGVLSKGAF